MRRLRRITAIVTHLLMIQFAIVSGAPVCQMAGGMDASASAATALAHTDTRAAHQVTTSHPSDAAHSHRRGGSRGGSHCDLPCTPATCVSAGHCPSAVALRIDAAQAPLAAVAARCALVRTAVPSSVRTAPEPPPPRIQAFLTLL